MLKAVLDGKFLRKYSVNVGVPQGSILGYRPLLIYINNLLGYALCNISVYGDTITPFSNFDQVSDLWQQVEMVSHLPGILNWGMEWVVDIDAVKVQLVSLDHRNNWVLST